MKKPVVVCGIDTGVGKSMGTGLLARHLMDQGKVVTESHGIQQLYDELCAMRP